MNLPVYHSARYLRNRLSVCPCVCVCVCEMSGNTLDETWGVGQTDEGVPYWFNRCSGEICFDEPAAAAVGTQHPDFSNPPTDSDTYSEDEESSKMSTNANFNEPVATGRSALVHPDAGNYDVLPEPPVLGAAVVAVAPSTSTFEAHKSTTVTSAASLLPLSTCILNGSISPSISRSSNVITCGAQDLHCGAWQLFAPLLASVKAPLDYYERTDPAKMEAWLRRYGVAKSTS